VGQIDMPCIPSVNCSSVGERISNPRATRKFCGCFCRSQILFLGNHSISPHPECKSRSKDEKILRLCHSSRTIYPLSDYMSTCQGANAFLSINNSPIILKCMEPFEIDIKYGEPGELTEMRSPPSYLHRCGWDLGVLRSKMLLVIHSKEIVVCYRESFLRTALLILQSRCN